MADSGVSSGEKLLTSRTPILHQKLYVIAAAAVVLIILAVLVLLFTFLRRRSSSRRRIGAKQGSALLPLACTEVNQSDQTKIVNKKVLLMDELARGVAESSITESSGSKKKSSSESNESSVVFQSDSSSSSCSAAYSDGLGKLGWGIRWYSLQEVEIATNRFSGENVVGEGGCGVVFRGVLSDGSVVAVKRLLDKKGQAEKELKVEVEAIGKVRHKNLVGLIGYCAEGAERFLVYEYIDNGNLEQWLHGDAGQASPLTWEIRIKIAIGAARGLAYLHEGLEPKVVHRDVKSSNILLDRNWNAKVSDFGLAKLLGPEKSYVATRVMGTFGYVSPDYASTGMLNEGNDVYSFGVLLMEIITGRRPVDHSRPPGEMNLVDLFKRMIASSRGEELVDPLIVFPPPQRALKRILLLCLRCIDLDAAKRPKMGQIVHMLEADEFPYRAETRPFCEPLRLQAIGNNNIPSAQKEVVKNDNEDRPQRG